MGQELNLAIYLKNVLKKIINKNTKYLKIKEKYYGRNWCKIMKIYEKTGMKFSGAVIPDKRKKSKKKKQDNK